MTGNRPSGTVTFLFTDIEGSTRLWDDHPDAMKVALAQHDELLKAAIEGWDGYVFATGGDGFAVAFHTPTDAVEAAVRAQLDLGAASFAEGLDLKVRMGIHTGTADERGDDFFGATPSRAARVMDAGWGGQILVSEVASRLVDADRTIEIGEHRLRDLATSEVLSQVVAEGLERSFPPPRTASSTANNLPIRHDSFIGRAELVEELAPQLRAPGLTTLVGVGGVGKTRLALQAAAHVLPHHPDGVWFCELAPAGDEDAALAVVASVLGAKQQPNETLQESIVGFLRNRRLLLLLDNCEHLVEGAADLAEAIGTSCPDIHILATSREGLAVAGERIVAVPTLAIESDAELPPGVELFLDRALARGADVSMLEGNVGHIGEIVRRLDGLPLAIELAAARSASMTPGDMVEHLDARFELLTGGNRRRRDRTRTLQQAIDWSHDLLEVEEQVVFRRLGVIAGSFDLKAAKVVASLAGEEDRPILDVLDGLVSRSLLNVESGPTGETRYRYLETIRHYAEAKLEEAHELDATSAAHVVYLSEWIAACASESAGSDELSWLDRLGLEVPNIRRAVDWCERGGDPQPIIDMLGPFVARVVHSGETIAPIAASIWGDELIDLERGYRVAALAALHEIEAGSEAEARRLSDLAGAKLDLSDPLASLVLHTRSFVEIIYPSRDDSYRRATEWAREAIELAREQDDLEGLVQNLTMLTYAAPLCGDGPQPAAAQEAYELAQRLGAPNVLASAAWGLGSRRFEDGDYATARKHFLEAATLSTPGSMTWAAGTLWVAASDLKQGEDMRVLRTAAEIVGATHRSGLFNMSSAAVLVGAAALARTGRFEEAATLYGGAVTSASVMPPALRELEEVLGSEMDSEARDECERRGQAFETDELVAFATAAFDRALQDLEPA